MDMEKIIKNENLFQLMSSIEILTRDNKTEAINKNTGTYSSETQPDRQENLEVDMVSANSNQKNLHMINKLMIPSMAIKRSPQMRSCNTGRSAFLGG